MTETKKSKSLKIDIPQPEVLKPKITIFGAGGAGGNAINNMIRSNLEGVEFVAANTDSQALQNSLAEYKIQLGAKVTKGLGAGSFPDRGRAAAEENIEDIEQLLKDSNMVFIAAGMGGGTGTGAAPVIAKLARERDILTVGVVTKPFHFEGKYRMETAEKGIDELKKYVDTLIVIPNQNLFRIANEQTTFESAFKMADDVLHAGVRGVTDLITMPGLVNLDFADIRTIMTKMGKAMMGTGEAEGENRAVEACEAAISNPLLDDISIKGAKGVLVNMTGGPDMTLFEADMAVNAIKKEVDSGANIIFGSAFNENMKGKIRISVVATGIDVEEFQRDALATPEVNEPSRFSVDLNDDNKNIANNENRSFFDPGIPAKSNDKIEEISDVGFKSKQPYLKEQNQNHISADNKNNAPKNNKSNDDFAKASFFANELENKLGNQNSDQDLDNKDKVKSRKKSTKSSKKESSGFSLFSFMNSSKYKNQEEEPELEDQSNDDDFLDDEQNKFQLDDIRQDKKQPIAPAQEQELDDSNNEENNQVKNEEIDKKRQKFFSSTIFDEDSSKIVNEKIEDDILNVPAFFRRKKK